MSTPKYRPWYLLLAALFCLSASLPGLADSHVRIVRLSYIEGAVEVAHGDAQAYQKAIINLPITEGTKLKTSDQGRAEVEFEDGSTLRLISDSLVEFPQLSLRDSGARVSDVEVTKGIVYVNSVGNRSDEFSVGFGREKVILAHAARLRIVLRANNSSVAVFKGSVEVEGPSGTTQLAKNQTLSFNLADDNNSKLAKNIHQEPWDSWDDQQDQYHSRYASNSYSSYSPYAYGTTDLSYYGNFFNAPGYGMMWQPYFVGAGWDPFMDGAWSPYPGGGFGWVSAYPWGWTPYHYGTWIFLPSSGWAWQPGGAWNSGYAQPLVLNAPKGFTVPRPPAAGTSTVFVNRGSTSELSGSKLVIRNNSAGLGVPRGQMENMAKLSRKVETRGMASIAMAGPWEQHTEASPRMYAAPMHQTSGISASSAHSSSTSSGSHK
jgi:FecR protein